ncbi:MULTISPECIES: Ig-like domain-containing protein [Hydrocarboniphaga]|jgi:hypothetical protein|uniref:Ig-like domain-containing protein n=1 Tax=Hydrocarboniphaga TaxID=243627 RepID=UPI002AB85350|nr:Ig-like domain-containing protein [Hydrocarboniphaga sp.]MDZ4077512.1 Ig-like domain-containing protein [Hydrocarboniphaga sp.]
MDRADRRLGYTGSQLFAWSAMKLGHFLGGAWLALASLLVGCGSSSDSGGDLSSDPGAVTTPALTITGPESVSSGGSQSYVVSALLGTAPVSGVAITLTTSLGTLSLASTDTTTDARGELPFTLSAIRTGTSSSGTATTTPVTGTAYVTAKGMVGGKALEVTKDIKMTPAVFQFTAPAAATTVSLNSLQPLVLQWTSNSLAVSAPVTFSAKLGTLVDADGNAANRLTLSTDSSGFARLQVVSSTAGTETITATGESGSGTSPTATLTLRYIGEPASFTVAAASPISAANGASTLTAKVVDGSGNAVSGASVSFSIASAPSGGTLSPTVATTDSSGIATALYRANGVAGTAKINITAGSLATQAVTIVINN